jgi:hypothetical protein
MGVEIDVKLHPFLAYHNDGTPPVNIYFNGHQNDVGVFNWTLVTHPPILKKNIFRPLFLTILKNEIEGRTIFELTDFLNKTLFMRDITQHAFCFGSITKEDLTIAL